MKLHNYLAGIALALTSFSAAAYTEVNRYGQDDISDLALIYAGGSQRPQWTVDDVMPYVVHTYADGSKDWFFDGFLLLEFSSGDTGICFDNGAKGTPSTKADWEWLLGRHISALASIDSAITLGKASLGEPRLRHKVVLGMPSPIKRQGIGWGEVDGRQLDFAKVDDRIAASKWYVSEAIRRFDEAGFKNIDLSGLYWLEESLFTNGEVVPAVNDWIYRKTMRSYWIPYYKNNAEFRFNWSDKYHFDVAYQQPNYFFEREVPMSQLEAACDESKKYGMALEMEFETQGKSCVQHDAPDSYYDRLVDYLDVFERKGVFAESAVAWYSGTKGFIDLANSTDSCNHAIADRMARIVAKRQAAKAASYSFPEATIRDAALIWIGAGYRIDWTPEQFEPYVAHTFADGSKDWLFDGYMFLDGSLYGGPDGKEKVPFYPVAGYEGAKKEDWQHFIDIYFQEGKAFDALDKCIAKFKAELGDPGFRHKVHIPLPPPTYGNKHWGELDGRPLDFSNDSDRVAAAEWYLNQFIDRFNAAGYANLDLDGVYWFDEDLIYIKDFPKYIAPFIHSKGLQFSWIPYFKARGYERWREMGFDIVYTQPGHFFEWTKPDKRLDEAIDLSWRQGVGLEFECDGEAISQHPGSKMPRMQKYIDAFHRHGVWQKSPVAWYTGSKAFLDMKNNPSPENQAMMDQVARIIVDRRALPGIVKDPVKSLK